MKNLPSLTVLGVVLAILLMLATSSDPREEAPVHAAVNVLDDCVEPAEEAAEPPHLGARVSLQRERRVYQWR